MNVNVNWNDIQTTVGLALPYVIAGLVVIAIILGIRWAANRSEKTSARQKKINNRLSIFGIVATIVVVANSIVFIPLQTILTSYFLPKVTLSDNVKKMGNDLGEQIASEGDVLLKNANNTLPLKEGERKVNVFGWSSTNPVYGGTGSGSVDASQAVDLLTGLKNAGIEYNEELSNFYKEFRSARPRIQIRAQDWTVPEPTITQYEEADMFNKAKAYSDTAVVVISRSGGEGADIASSLIQTATDSIEKVTLKDGRTVDAGLRTSEYAEDQDPEKHYLELSNREQAMLNRVEQEFDKVIVVVNVSNTFEMGFVNNEAIDAALWVGAPGQTGFNALGRILTGEVNPSGRTTDTYLYDLKQDPTFANIGKHHYTGTDDLFQKDLDPSLMPGYQFVDYREGIYLGYRFFETYYRDNNEGYNNAVQYPFGYGLSYSNFEKQLVSSSFDGQTVHATVSVRNTGSVPGKEVVQLYQTAPYTNGGIEKSEVELVAFDKTKELAPNETETMTFDIPVEKLASYDYRNQKAYVLESGEYALKLMNNSHEVIQQSSFTVPSTIVYSGSNQRSTDKAPVTNQFDHAEGDLEYLSRANNFENYSRVIQPAVDREMSQALIDEAKLGPDLEGGQAPTFNAKNGLSLSDLVGVDYNDEKWNQLLDQMSVDEMVNMVAKGGYQTQAVRSINKPATIDIDGPAGLNTFVGSGKRGSASPVAVVMAATWNTDLALQRGTLLGYEALELGVNGWYGPAMNLHRGAFGGRNFEYYSEDPYIAAEFSKNETKGAQDKGLYAYIKHFALNEQESNRNSRILVWANEQAIRQLYLKPFEASVEDGGATAVMSSYNYIGSRWAGADSNLLNNVLRSEWGYKGLVLTDYFGNYDYMNGDAAIANGNDIMLSTLGTFGATPTHTDNAKVQQNLRQASKNVLYTVANSNAMYSDIQKDNMLTEVGGRVSRASLFYRTAQRLGLEGWMFAVVIADVLVLAALAALLFRGLKKQ